MSTARRTPPSRRGASLAATPATTWPLRSDSLARLGAASSSSATPASPASSRSKKKRMRRSSLEFLGDVGGGGAASSVGDGSASGRKRKHTASFSSAFASVTPSSASAAEAVLPQRRQRQISPRSQSKLNRLARLDSAPRSNSRRLEEKQSRKKGGRIPGSEGSAAEKSNTVPPAKRPATEPAKAKSAKKPKEGQRKNIATNAATDESRTLTLTNDSSLHQSKPPTNRKAKKRAILFARSNNDRSNAADEQKPKAIPSDSNHSSLGKNQPASTKKRAILFSQASDAPSPPSDHLTPKTNRAAVRQKRSPGIFSDSPLDYRPEENGADDGESPATCAAATPMMKSYAERWTKPSPENNDGEGDEGCPDRPDDGGEAGEERSVNSPGKAESASSSVVTTSSNSDGDEEEEGGGHDNGTTADQSRQLVADRSDGKQLVRSESEGVFPMSPDLNEGLALEYGRLAFLKRQLEHRMRTEKMDAETIRPLANGAPAFGMGSAVAANYVAAKGKEGEDDPMDPPDPSREEVAFGEMAFRQMMAEQRLAEWKSGGGREESDEEDGVSPDVGQQEGRIRTAHRDENPHVQGANPRRGEYGDSYNDRENDGYFDGRHAAMSIKGPSSKPKKKRKRRVVETITRVIHEESEEEGGSTSTEGGERHGSRHFQARRKGGQFSSSYHGDEEEEDANYVSKYSNGERSVFDRKGIFPLDGGAPRRRIERYNHEQSDGDSFQSGDGSINWKGNKGFAIDPRQFKTKGNLENRGTVTTSDRSGSIRRA